MNGGEAGIGSARGRSLPPERELIPKLRRDSTAGRYVESTDGTRPYASCAREINRPMFAHSVS